MCLPSAFGDLHIGKYRLKARFFGTASVNAEPYRAFAFPHMTHSHLREVHAVIGAFDTIIVLTAAETIPHSL